MKLRKQVLKDPEVIFELPEGEGEDEKCTR